MEYEWDENKAVANLSKHGVSFVEAKTVFDDPLTWISTIPTILLRRTSFYPARRISTREIIVRFFIMERNNIIRLISAREATPSERKAYEQE